MRPAFCFCGEVNKKRPAGDNSGGLLTLYDLHKKKVSKNRTKQI